MTKFKLLETIGYFGKGEISMEQMIDAVDSYSSALLQQTPCTTHLPVWAVELLTEIRFRVLVDLDQDGEPRSSMAELMAMWDKVNDALHLNTIGKLR